MKVHFNESLASYNLSNNRINLMLNGDTKALHMGTFEKLWDALCGLFRSEKQSESREALFELMNPPEVEYVNTRGHAVNSGIRPQSFFGAQEKDWPEVEKFNRCLDAFNLLKEYAIKPDTMVAKCSITPEYKLHVSFLINKKEVCTRELQLSMNEKGGIDLTNAYLPGVDLSDLDLSDADMRNANMINANLNGANMFNANLKSADMTGSTMNKTNLCCAKMDYARGANLGGAITDDIVSKKLIKSEL